MTDDQTDHDDDGSHPGHDPGSKYGSWLPLIGSPWPYTRAIVAPAGELILYSKSDEQINLLYF